MVTGKWNGKKYKLQRLLGAGSNGQVYLATCGRSVCALKFGAEAAELQGEANVLASLDKARKERGKSPFLLDVDDFSLEGLDIPFYAMRYIPGTPLKHYLKRHGSGWIGVIGCRLLEMLAELHEAGWVFSDLKSDNILVHHYGRVELVDYGGVTAIGRSVRQFTELYDRGYWSAGTRTAEPSYDWFAFGILWLHALDSRRLLQLSRTRLPQDRSVEDLMKLVRTHALLRPLEKWMESAFNGTFRDSRDALEQWKQAYWRSGRLKRAEAEVPAWMTGMLVISAVLCVSLAAIWIFH
jgi:serine/threonine-protein kinase